MLGVQPISAFAISEIDPVQDDTEVIKIKSFADDVEIELLWTLEIFPFQPGVAFAAADDDVRVKFSWLQFEVPE